MDTDWLGFLGLGRLGLPAAKNLVASGYRLRVWNRSPGKAEPVVAMGAELVSRPEQAAHPGGVLATLLWDDAAVREVIESDDLLARLEGGIHLSMSTLSPEGSVALAALHARHGSTLVEAPVFGGAAAAGARRLWMPIAGSASAKARVRPILEAMGAQGLYDFGETIGAATAVKLVGNFLILSAAAALKEGLSAAAAHGLDQQAVLAMMTETLFASSTYRDHGRLVVEGSTRLTQSAVPDKDLALFQGLAETAGAPATMARLLLELRKGPTS